MLWKWTNRREQAALEVARDLLPDPKIAGDAGVSTVTLWTWKKQPEFRARVQEHLDHWAEQLKALGLSDRQNRVTAKNERWLKLQQVIEERAEALADDCPGGATGLLVHQQKQIGGGAQALVVDEYVVDTGLLREMRELETEVAKELGQWVERKSVEYDEIGKWRTAALRVGASEEEADRIAAALLSKRS